ncbi:hypothetical protein CBS101457_002739 [Exobasidium rhododendri]|nr:hypothetical protein CBS101457_002739 [Exobasidium rhododendri]
MQRPGPPPQRPSAMNPLNFSRSPSGAAPTTGYNYLPRPSPSATSGTSNPFSRGFAFGNSSLPPHLAAFSGSGGGNGQAAGQTGQHGGLQQGGQSSLNINDFPALGGAANLASSGNDAVNYATSASGLLRSGEGVSNEDFPSLNEGFSGNGVGNNSNQEQVSAAATLQHQRIAREQNQTQTLNAARGGFGEPERNYATKVGMQQPPGMSIAQNWSSTGTGGLGSLESIVNGGSRLSDINDGNGGGVKGQGSTASMMSHNAAPQLAKTPAQQVLTSPADRFGLLGLLNIIKMQDPDLSMLAMGSDLQLMGMSLDSSDALSSSFVTPWSENSTAASLQIEPDFHLPSCYNVQTPPPPQSKVATFSDETLFFIFYSTPRDILQEVAAQELYNRNWRFYRGGLNLWLTKEENVQPTHKDLRAEKGMYIFWDPVSWSKVSREFVLAYDALEERTVGVSQASLAAGVQQQGISSQQAPTQTAQVGA